MSDPGPRSDSDKDLVWGDHTSNGLRFRDWTGYHNQLSSESKAVICEE